MTQTDACPLNKRSNKCNRRYKVRKMKQLSELTTVKYTGNVALTTDLSNNVVESTFLHEEKEHISKTMTNVKFIIIKID